MTAQEARDLSGRSRLKDALHSIKTAAESGHFTTVVITLEPDDISQLRHLGYDIIETGECFIINW
jgi:hypothetical protein